VPDEVGDVDALHAALTVSAPSVSSIQVPGGGRGHARRRRLIRLAFELSDGPYRGDEAEVERVLVALAANDVGDPTGDEWAPLDLPPSSPANGSGRHRRAVPRRGPRPVLRRRRQRDTRRVRHRERWVVCAAIVAELFPRAIGPEDFDDWLSRRSTPWPVSPTSELATRCPQPFAINIS
jgi:hypothetical protein